MNFFRFTLFFLLLCFVFPLASSADQLEDAKTAIKNEDFKKAFELLSPLAEEENAEAQTNLGAMYVNGQGVEKDFNKGMALIMKAASQDYKPAKLSAFKLCIDLANQGDISAMYNVGYMCFKDWGGEHDNDVCLSWMENAARLGHEKSSKILTSIYENGKFGVAPDAEKAAYWNKLSEAFASGIDGKWTASISMGPNGPPMDVIYNFKTEGDKLTGTTLGGGKESEIKEGKIDGNDFSFKIISLNMGNKSTFKYNGLFRGDTLKITMISDFGFRGPSQPMTFDAKRAE